MYAGRSLGGGGGGGSGGLTPSIASFGGGVGGTFSGSGDGTNGTAGTPNTGGGGGGGGAANGSGGNGGSGIFILSVVTVPFQIGGATLGVDYTTTIVGSKLFYNFLTPGKTMTITTTAPQVIDYFAVGGGGGGQLGASAFNFATFQSAGLANAGVQGGGGGQTAPGSSGGRWNGAGYSQGNGAGGGGYYGGGRGENLNQGLAGGGGSGFLAVNIQRGYMPLANIATTTMTNTSNVTAPLSDLMETFGMSPTVYGHGSGGTGLIVLVPVLGSNVAPIIGVDARFITG